MSSLTVNQIAEKLNVSRDVAYGLIRFMEATKILRPVGKLLTGDRGKPAYQYQITDEDLGAFAGLLATLMADEVATPDATVTAAPVESPTTV